MIDKLSFILEFLNDYKSNKLKIKICKINFDKNFLYKTYQIKQYDIIINTINKEYDKINNVIYNDNDKEGDKYNRPINTISLYLRKFLKIIFIIIDVL